ncbi:MAG TPA: hypothetical protein VGK24_09015 [Candidatus Angelobacter sp.]|jgi:hypothetical protein
MDPFARKMVHGSFVFGGVLLIMFAVLSVVYLHTRPRCSDRVVAQSTAPDNAFTATVMERRCGEDKPFFTHVNLRPAAQDLNVGFFSGSSTEGEVLLIEQDAASAGIRLNWSAPSTLNIQCAGCNAALVRKREEHWGNVSINYDLPK